MTTMKKNSILLILPMLLFLFSLCFSGCDSDDTIEETFYPNKDVDNDVIAFFEGMLKPNKNAFFDIFNDMYHVDTCLVINSMEEFRSLSPKTVDFPTIDFSTHTVIVGKFMETAGYIVKEHKVKLTDGKLSLCLYIADDGYDAHTCDMMDYYYWGVYGKLPSRIININQIEI